MSIMIVEDSFLKLGFGIKHIVGWDNLFKTGISGPLKFYNSNPQNIVDVSICRDVHDNFTDEDITVTYSSHNFKDIKDAIKHNEDTIWEFCVACKSDGFVLDLGKMNIVEESDFTDPFPRFGLNTFFIFENLSNSVYYCLVNPAKNINDSDFYSWFISYIYSARICLTPRNKIDIFAKQFLQAISLISLGGGKSNTHVAKNRSVLECGLSDNGEFLLDVPGKTARYEQLTLKSINQLKTRKGKK